FFFQAEDGIRDFHVTGVQTCALPISGRGECIELQLSDYVQLDNVYVEGAEYDGLKIRGGRFIQVNNFRAHNCTKGGLQMSANGRSEERRVGKECRCRWSPCR